MVWADQEHNEPQRPADDGWELLIAFGAILGLAILFWVGLV